MSSVDLSTFPSRSSNNRSRKFQGLMAPLLATVAMFIVDQFSYESGVATVKPEGKHIGGGGTYVTVGARVWCVTASTALAVASMTHLSTGWRRERRGCWSKEVTTGSKRIQNSSTALASPTFATIHHRGPFACVYAIS